MVPHIFKYRFIGEPGVEDPGVLADGFGGRVSGLFHKIGVHVLNDAVHIRDDDGGWALCKSHGLDPELFLGLADVEQTLLQGSGSLLQHDMNTHAGAQYIGIDGLMDKVDRAIGECPRLAHDIRLGRDEDDRNVASLWILFQDGIDLIAIHLWHHHIQQNKVRQFSGFQ